MATLLVVDDEPGICYSIDRVFTEGGVTVVTAGTAAAGLVAAREHLPDVIVLDLQLPDRSGLDLFTDLLDDDPKRPVVFITAHGTTEVAIEAVKRGAFDYLIKPVDIDRLTAVVGRAFEAARLMRTPAVLPSDPPGDRIIGRSPAMQEMGHFIGRVAPQDVNVLILGESGSGKELVARAIYQHSKRAGRPFRALNCAAIPDALLESELFGHEKGAFTGADRQRVGTFEQAHGGTLFLDEIGDMPPAAQAKVLRVLQDQRFERVGGGDAVHTDVRVLAATNQDLDRAVAEGRFRLDLLYRLKVVTIRVPALRDRPGDIPELAHHFLFRFNRELNLDLRGFDPVALTLLQRFHWPGNVRELQSAIKEAMLRSRGHLLRPEDLSDAIRRGGPLPVAAEPEQVLDAVVEEMLSRNEKDLHGQVVRFAERAVIARVLNHTQGHLLRASELLGINRSTLRAKMRELGLAPAKADDDEPPTGSS